MTMMNNNRYIVTSPKTITDYMPSLFVEKVRATTDIGDHVKFAVQDSYSIDGSSRMVNAVVLGKNETHLHYGQGHLHMDRHRAL